MTFSSRQRPIEIHYMSRSETFARCDSATGNSLMKEFIDTNKISVHYTTVDNPQSNE